MAASLRTALLAAAVSVATAALKCVDLKPAKFCEDYQTARSFMPQKVCSSSNKPVSLEKWGATEFKFYANATCTKNPSLVTRPIFCQVVPQENFIPCTGGLACPASPKLCFDLCLKGGKTSSHTFLGTEMCTGNGEAYCINEVLRGKVAPKGDKNCAGLDYFKQYARRMLAQTPFQPRACAGRFPIFNKIMLDMNTATRIDFMKSLAKKLNRIWNYTESVPPYKWYRPVNIRLRRVQMMKGVVQMFAEVKEFCLVKMRKGPFVPNLLYNNDQYCDKISVTPDEVFANLTKLLNTKKPDRGMMIGEFRVKKESSPGWPAKPCYTWQPEVKPDIPGWVWMLTAIASMCCLLSILILQHRYRNRASYVRLNEKLRSYV